LQHGLTRKGREQAAVLANRLHGSPITRIYSSPLLRAVETSVIVANRLDLDYEVTDALREYDCGILEGRSDEASWRTWRELFDAWAIHQQYDRRIEGGESFRDLRDRFVPFIRGVVSRYENTRHDILCVSHGGVYQMMLPIILKNVDRARISRYGMDYANCVVAEARPDGLVCVAWNEHPVDKPPVHSA
jgi:broad specificity phosphatase PhoE